MPPEIRRVCEGEIELRAGDGGSDDGDGRNFSGYAAVFNQPTQISGWEGTFNERMSKGAFKKTLRDREPVMQFDHGRDTRVGSVPIGHFTNIREDDHGLAVEARLFDNPVVEPVRQAIEAKAVRGMSIKFHVTKERWRDNSGKIVKPDELGQLLYEPGERGPLDREIREVRLLEAGPVVHPAYPGTSASVRSSEGEDERIERMAANYRETFDAEDEESEERDETEATEDADAPKVAEERGEESDDWTDEQRAEYDSALAELEVESDERAMAKSGKAKEPYGDVKYADPGYQKDGKKRYPIDTKEHVVAAWDYISKQSNADKYSSDDLKKVKSAIKSAAKKFGVTISDSEKKSSDAESAETQTTDAQNGTARAGQSGDTDERAKSPENNTKSAQTQRKAETKMPKTLDELIARQAEIEARLAELGEIESRSDEQDEEFDGLADERTAVIEAQKRIKARQEVLKSLAETGSSERGSDKAPAFHRDRGDIYDLAEIRKESYGTDDFLVRVDDNAKRAIERAAYGANDKSKAQEHVQHLLDTVDTEDRALAKRILLTGSAEYERAFTKVLRYGSDALCTPEERAALLRTASVPQALGTDGAGGYAVPFQLDPTVILTSAGVVNPIRNLARVEQIVGKEWQGVTSAGATVSRGAEGAEAPDSGFTLAQPTVRTNRVQGFVAFNIEIDLSWNALRSEITRLLVDAKGREENSFITGNGSGTAPGGVLGSLNLATDGAAGHSGVATLTNGAYVVADLYHLEEALDARWEPNATFLAHKKFYNLTRQLSPNGPGSSFWVTLGDGTPPRLLDYRDERATGFPAPDLATDSAPLAMFGDFSQFLIVDRIGMTVELIPNLLGSNGRPTGQRGVYAVWMNNSKVLVPDAFKVLVNKPAG